MVKTYRTHRCQARHRNVRTFLQCAIRKLEWAHGQGDIALIAWCSVPTVTLHTSIDSAESARDLIDVTGCGGRCRRNHDIVRIDLDRQEPA